jgi:Domain of unknown function (DUF1996)
MQWKVLSLALALCSTRVHGVPAESGLLAARQQAPPSGCCATAAMMRFECSQLVIERLDPLVQPGVSPSAHMHQIAGGNSFQANMTPVAYNPSVQSNCTSCTYSEDFSNYWTANLFFRARNGTFKRVPQLTNLGLRGKNGGLTVYYIPPYDRVTNVTTFKPIGKLVQVETNTNLRSGLSNNC